jgi:hypothetical protein
MDGPFALADRRLIRRSFDPFAGAAIPADPRSDRASSVAPQAGGGLAQLLAAKQRQMDVVALITVDGEVFPTKSQNALHH